ncbi:MAG: hypothetical protein C5S48_04280 [Candidatus Methanogaster sp.]|nr:MAG: hypothetical protein C5S48_04280 [ANME-2 cluster archaeon]
MTSFNVSALEIFVYGTLATISIGYIIERILTWHEAKIITIQKRSDEFIELSKDWYMPLAFAAGAIVAETDPAYEIRPKILFFKLAKFLSLHRNFLDSSVGYIFPKETQENKVLACGQVFGMVVNLLVFNDDGKLIEHTIEYYRKNSDLVSFVNEIEEFPEYDALKHTIDDENVRKMLYEHADEFKKSITDGVTEEYKIWYKFEFNKKAVVQKVYNNESYKEETIRNLHKELSENRGDCMEKVPNVR